MALSLAYTEEGAGPPLVILHGLFGSARNWRAIAKRLASAYHVYALDLRNHGDSPWAASMTYRDLADDVRAFIDARRLGGAGVIGHSMGGKAAMVLALEEPELVRALIVLDIAPVAYPHSFLPYVQAMQALDLPAIARRGEADAALARRIPDPAIRLFLLQSLAYRGGRYAWRMNLAALAANMQALLAFPEPGGGRRYDGPALFLYGARSGYVRPEHQEPIRRLFPQARIRALADAGHWAHVERPQAFTEAVRAFFDEHLR